MTLESGDKLWMCAAPGQMALQICSHQHAGGDDMSARGRSDVVDLVGREVARLLFALERALRYPGDAHEVVVCPAGSRGGALKVEWSDLFRVLSLIGQEERVILTEAETLLFRDAVGAAALKMFQ